MLIIIIKYFMKGYKNASLLPDLCFRVVKCYDQPEEIGSWGRIQSYLVNEGLYKPTN